MIKYSIYKVHYGSQIKYYYNYNTTTKIYNYSNPNSDKESPIKTSSIMMIGSIILNISFKISHKHKIHYYKNY